MRALTETAVASGSACTSADVKPSHVITAMHDEQRAHSSIWISVGRSNDGGQTRRAVSEIARAVRQLRKLAL